MSLSFFPSQLYNGILKIFNNVLLATEVSWKRRWSFFISLFQDSSVTSENSTQGHLNQYIISFFKVIIEVFFQKSDLMKTSGVKSDKNKWFFTTENPIW